MESLFEFLTEVVADRIKNKSVGYVRKYFGVENDFNPEEEAECRNCVPSNPRSGGSTWPCSKVVFFLK